MVEEVVGELELEEEEGEVEALAHDEVGEVPGVVVEDCLVVLHKLLDHRLLQDSGVEPEQQVKNVWFSRHANSLTTLSANISVQHICTSFEQQSTLVLVVHLDDAVIVLGVLAEHDGALAVGAE